MDKKKRAWTDKHRSEGMGFSFCGALFQGSTTNEWNREEKRGRKLQALKY